MKRNDFVFGQYFCGNKVSDYGLQHGRVDYATLAKSFDAVLNNEIIAATGWENWEQENGFIDNSDEINALEEKIATLEEKRERILSTDYENEYQKENDLDQVDDDVRIARDMIYDLQCEQDEQPEIYQYYIISGNGAEILEDYTDEIVFYNNELDMYVWGVTHWGTSWDYVLTNIKCEKVEKGA